MCLIPECYIVTWQLWFIFLITGINNATLCQSNIGNLFKKKQLQCFRHSSLHDTSNTLYGVNKDYLVTWKRYLKNVSSSMQFYFHWGITEIKNGAFYVGLFTNGLSINVPLPFLDLTDVHGAPLRGSVRRGDEVFCCGGILSNSGPFAPKSTQDSSADTVPKQRPQHQHSSISTHITTLCPFVAHRPVCQREHRPTRRQCVRMSSEGFKWKPEGQEQDRNWTPWLRP